MEGLPDPAQPGPPVGGGDYRQLLRRPDDQRYRSLGVALLITALLPVGLGADGALFVWQLLPAATTAGRAQLLSPAVLAVVLVGLSWAPRLSRLGQSLGALGALALAMLIFSGSTMTYRSAFQGVLEFIGQGALPAVLGLGLIAAGADLGGRSDDLSLHDRAGACARWLLGGGSALVLLLYALPFRDKPLLWFLISRMVDAAAYGGLRLVMGKLLFWLLGLLPLGIAGVALAVAVQRRRRGNGFLLSVTARYGLPALTMLLCFRLLFSELNPHSILVQAKTAVLLAVVIGVIARGVEAIARHLLVDSLPPFPPRSTLARDVRLRQLLRAYLQQGAAPATVLDAGRAGVPPSHPWLRWLMRRRLQELAAELPRPPAEPLGPELPAAAAYLALLEARALTPEPPRDAVGEPAAGVPAVAAGDPVEPIAGAVEQPDAAEPAELCAAAVEQPDAAEPAEPPADAVEQPAEPGAAPAGAPEAVATVAEREPAALWLATGKRRLPVLIAAVVLLFAAAAAAKLHRPQPDLSWQLRERTAAAEELFASSLPKYVVALARRERLSDVPGPSAAATEALQAESAALVTAAQQIDLGLGTEIARVVGTAGTVDQSGQRWVEAIHRVNRQVRRLGLPYYVDGNVMHVTSDHRTVRRIFYVTTYRVAGLRRFRFDGRDYAALRVLRLDDLNIAGERLGMVRPDEPFALIMMDGIERSVRDRLEALRTQERCGLGEQCPAALDEACGRTLLRLLQERGLDIDRPEQVEPELAELLVAATERHEVQHQIDGDDVVVPPLLFAIAPTTSEHQLTGVAQELSAQLAELATDDDLATAWRLADLLGHVLSRSSLGRHYRYAAGVIINQLYGKAVLFPFGEISLMALIGFWEQVELNHELSGWIAPIARRAHEDLFGSPIADLALVGGS